jgi:hypothetical protein
MSFFGALAGLGQGIADEGAYQEKANLQKEALAEKSAAALALQRERNQDRADRERENLMLRKELGMGGKGGGGGGNVIENMFLNASTPEEKSNVIEYIRARGGDEAGEAAAQRFGMGRTTRLADPAREDVTGYVDATGGIETAVPAAVSVPGGRTAQEAEKGRIALNRVFGMASGKFKDFSEGEARAVGTDAVRGATDDAGLRKAGAVNMALEGKDRFGVQGDQTVDKAMGDVKPTDLGKAKATDERASAGEHSAKAAKAKAEADPDSGKGSTAADKAAIARARERRLDIKDQIATTIKKREQGLMTKDEAKSRLAELESQQMKYDKIIRDGEDEPAPKAAVPARPAASTPKTRPPLNSFMKK